MPEMDSERPCTRYEDQDMRTSDAYKTNNLPFRFDHPSKWNYGNCVFNASDGPPCIHTMPLTYHTRNHKYWEHLSSVGMYRNRGFNTAIDRAGA
ncbi:uncharacterized protein CEXT_225211 [Caerostris extrusa]|uniref:Uncharacterized protein n=1 Tax=Caerostris extrusa TaxID=172846 RepID=A0AAV4XL69_CAEEX|nr:uncharacterized protein CEXT_225211 [Caerostris extrusa]